MDMDRFNSLEVFNENLNKLKDADCRMNSIDSEIQCCQNFVPKFFTDNDSDKGIRYMYSVIDSPDLSSREISDVVDVRHGYHVYKEYLDGMIKFINELINTQNPSDEVINVYKNRLDIANAKDIDFISGLFNGCKFNEKRNMNLSEAAGNLEFLVDFFDEMKEILKKCNNFKNYTSSDNELIKSSINMLASSVSCCCATIIETVIKTYYKIMDAIKEDNNVAPKPVQYKLL